MFTNLSAKSDERGWHKLEKGFKNNWEDFFSINCYEAMTGLVTLQKDCANLFELNEMGKKTKELNYSNFFA